MPAPRSTSWPRRLGIEVSERNLLPFGCLRCRRRHLLGLAALTAFVVVYGRIAETAGAAPSVPLRLDCVPARRCGPEPDPAAPAVLLVLVAACFPIITSVLAVFTHMHGGVARVEVLLRNFLSGFCGFAAFCFVLAISLPALTTAAAFSLAAAAALAVQAATFLLCSRLLLAPSGAQLG